ncbi:nucleoside hydrolase [Clathrospora elynae]|uniref:Nucleoside hydrolase n=1 Tax=Clathrospora elynae TaxID=706981 RepID=A0A6A5SLM5_9PLEO|nr:nucleoside hydrolase [Clathrospora elynae]
MMAFMYRALDSFLVPHRVLKLALTVLPLSASVALDRRTEVRNLIVDTDLFSDIDDAAALLLACTLPETKLLAVNVNVNSTYSAIAASAITNHYGYPFVPIGLPRPYANTSFFDTYAYALGEYTSKIAYHWSGGSVPFFELDATWDPVELYRKTLAESQNGSVTIASIGFSASLSGLLNTTADAYSILDGYGLVAEKVKELVIMGGGYPSGHEFNFWGQNASHTAHVVNTWPDSVPMTFLGTEVGEAVSTGARLTVSGPENDPVKAGYQWYVGYNNTRASWDPLTVAYAVEGLGDWFEYGNKNGYNYVYPNGSNTWMDGDSKTNQHYLKLKVSNETVAMELDNLLLRGARMHANYISR